MPGRKRAAPEPDAVGIDARQAARVGDRRRPVVELPRNRDELARLAVACPEMAVVEEKHMEAGLREALRVRLQRTLACAAEPVAHDDARCGPSGVRGRRIDPSAASDAVAQEFGVTA